MRTGEFRHNKTTSAKVADEAPEDRIRYSRHGREDGRGRDGDVADRDVPGETHMFSLASR